MKKALWKVYLISPGTFWKAILGHIFCTEIEILNSGSHDISQKLKQTKCILFKIWRLKCTTIPKKPFGEIGVLVNLIIQRWKSKHLVCLSFWDMSCDPEFTILISVQKRWPYINQEIYDTILSIQEIQGLWFIHHVNLMKSKHTWKWII